MSLQGIDVSRWQGVIDWDVAKRRLGFAVIKSTGGDLGLYVDGQYDRNIYNARLLKIRRGTYHFAGGTDPVAEARFYVAHTGRRDGEMQVLDFEGPVLDVHNPVGWALTFLREVHRLTKNKPVIYMSGSVAARFDWDSVVKAGFPLWDASWGSVAPKPAHWQTWALWQSADDGSWPGVSGNVDLDVFNGGALQWRRLARTEKPVRPHPKPPKPKPTPKPVHHRRVYVVKSGDTFWSIAHHFRVSLLRLIHANPQKKNPAWVYPGDRIYIP